MKVLITPIDSVIKVESIAVIDQASINKLNNPVNAERINNHLKDVHAKHEVIINKDNVTESHLYRIVDNVTEHDIKVIKAQHSSFLEHVYNMPEIEVVNLALHDNQQVNEDDEKKLKAVSEMLKGIDEAFNDNDILIIGDHTGPFFIGFSEIKVSFFKEIIDAYIDKKMNNNG